MEQRGLNAEEGRGNVWNSKGPNLESWLPTGGAASHTSGRSPSPRGRGGGAEGGKELSLRLRCRQALPHLAPDRERHVREGGGRLGLWA